MSLECGGKRSATPLWIILFKAESTMTQTKAPSTLRSAGALQNRIIIIGAGHNGLVTACYLPKAGLKPLVLERRAVVGGACVTEEIHPGFRCSTLAQNVSPLFPRIVKNLELERHGLELIQPAVRVFSLNTNGASVGIYEDTKRTVDELKDLSAKDADSYPEFISTFARIGRAISPLLTMTPPDIDKPAKSELWSLGKLGWAIRGLGKKDEYRLLRYGPMAVADLAELDLGERYALILGVTVLQHILMPSRLRASIDRLAAHLAPGGQIVLLEAAPSRQVSRCDSPVFVAREAATYLAAFAQAGLRCVAIYGVDPAPFKILFLPWYPRLPRPLALAGLVGVTALSFPLDVMGGRRLVYASWHKVFVLERAESG